ncbi:MAG: hypothetical protein N4A40_10000 [Tissierellales bacterium]|jgi:hypothetical protein|nr:hypothetical protein [Tissierellales bacterium]
MTNVLGVYEPDNIYAAGSTDIERIARKTAVGVNIAKYQVVAVDESGDVIPSVSPDDAYGISAEDIVGIDGEKQNVVLCATGCFQKEGIVFPDGKTADDYIDALKKCNIFLK